MILNKLIRNIKKFFVKLKQETCIHKDYNIIYKAKRRRIKNFDVYKIVKCKRCGKILLNRKYETNCNGARCSYKYKIKL